MAAAGNIKLQEERDPKIRKKNPVLTEYQYLPPAWRIGEQERTVYQQMQAFLPKTACHALSGKLSLLPCQEARLQVTA